MKLIPTAHPDVLLFEPAVHRDERGWFMETYNQAVLASLGLDVTFVQDNHSFSRHQHTLRGLHVQTEPAAQAKLVRCTRGSVLDVAVDLRQGSPHWLSWVSVELSADNKRQLFIPRGFAHAFLTLEDDCEVMYKVDRLYDAACSRSIRYDDTEIGIVWGEIEPVLSLQDRFAPTLADSDVRFVYGRQEAQLER